MVQMTSTVLENTPKFVLRVYGPGAAYSLECKILQREIFVRDQAAQTFMGTFQAAREKYMGMPLDIIFQRVWNRYVDLSTPLIFEPRQTLDD